MVYVHVHLPVQVQNVILRSAPVGELIEIGGYRFRSDIYSYYERLYVGGQICDPWNPVTNNFYGGRWYYGLYYVSCAVTEQIPGAYNASAILSDQRGASWNHSAIMQLGFDGKLSMFELYPGKLERLDQFINIMFVTSYVTLNM